MSSSADDAITSPTTVHFHPHSERSNFLRGPHFHHTTFAPREHRQHPRRDPASSAPTAPNDHSLEHAHCWDSAKPGIPDKQKQRVVISRRISHQPPQPLRPLCGEQSVRCSPNEKCFTLAQSTPGKAQSSRLPHVIQQRPFSGDPPASAPLPRHSQARHLLP